MRSYLVCAVLVLGASAPAHARCGAMPWSIPYLGSNTSTTMVVSSGEACPIDTGVGGTNIITSIDITAPASNGSASVNGDAVTYQSQAGYSGPDSFVFTLTGSGPGGSGSSAVRVTVNVQ